MCTPASSSHSEAEQDRRQRWVCVCGLCVGVGGVGGWVGGVGGAGGPAVRGCLPACLPVASLFSNNTHIPRLSCCPPSSLLTITLPVANSGKGGTNKDEAEGDTQKRRKASSTRKNAPPKCQEQIPLCTQLHAQVARVLTGFGLSTTLDRAPREPTRCAAAAAAAPQRSLRRPPGRRPPGWLRPQLALTWRHRRRGRSSGLG